MRFFNVKRVKLATIVTIVCNKVFLLLLLTKCAGRQELLDFLLIVDPGKNTLLFRDWYFFTIIGAIFKIKKIPILA